MKIERYGSITCILGDCMEFLEQCEPKQFGLAIVDPPYGIGANKMTLGNGKTKIYRGVADWDKQPPPIDYFVGLRQVSKNQIVWGANHFISRTPIDSSCWIVWDKGTGENDFADCELAWTSFGSTVRKYFKSWVGANAKEKSDKSRIHPTQKPVDLYKWLLSNYAKPGDKILDTHGGSFSHAIACHDLGFELTIIEKDEEYYKLGTDRLRMHQRQLKLAL